MTSKTTALLQNLATLRATRDAIMAEIDAINTAPADDLRMTEEPTEAQAAYYARARRAFFLQFGHAPEGF